MNCFTKLRNWRRDISKYNTANYLFNLIGEGTFNLLVKVFKNINRFGNSMLSIKFKDGMVIYFPIGDLKRFHKLFSLIPAESYLKHYKKYFKTELSFFKDDVIIDIGSHLGRFSLPINYQHRDTKVLAFEPDKNNYKCLLRSVNDSGLKESYRVYNEAIFDKKGFIEFSIGKETSLGSVGEVDFFLDNHTKYIKVRCTSLEDIFKRFNIKRCKLMKIDCEGSEYKILKTTSKQVFDKTDILFIEAHPTRFNRPEIVRDIIENVGFTVKGKKTVLGTWEFYCINNKFAKLNNIV